jgi:two-component system LytT family response regulator
MTAPVRVLVVDDETVARRRLLALLAEASDMRIVGESRNGLEAIDDIVRLGPDLVFLDVEMPERSGLEVVQEVGVERMPATIFVTAYDHYAVAAFEANAMDYLLKPFDGPRFERALVKARSWMNSNRGAESSERFRMTLAQASPAADRIWVRHGEARQPVKFDDIVHVGAEGNYVRLHTSTGNFVLRERMVGMMERLDPARFRRIHRSHIVNVDHVKKLLPWFGGDTLVMMSDGSRLTLSRSYKGALGL